MHSIITYSSTLNSCKENIVLCVCFDKVNTTFFCISVLVQYGMQQQHILFKSTNDKYIHSVYNSSCFFLSALLVHHPICHIECLFSHFKGVATFQKFIVQLPRRFLRNIHHHKIVHNIASRVFFSQTFSKVKFDNTVFAKE